MKKIDYEKPTVERLEFVVEEGIALSAAMNEMIIQGGYYDNSAFS